MATSSSDDSSAPLEFHISNSLDDNSKFSSPTEECPLCCKARKVFYCKICVRNGDFVHSSSHIAERFAEKQLRLMRLKKDRREMAMLCEAKMGGRQRRSQLASDIELYKERIKLLIQLTNQTKESILKKRKNSQDLKVFNQTRQSRLPRYELRVNKLESFVKAYCDEACEQKGRISQLHREIKNHVRKHVKQLVQYIFPISEVKPSRSQEDCDTVSALAEASRTAYIRGRWVYTDSSGELHHCIVAPTLPGSGDYSSYSDWVAANKDGIVPGSHSETVVHNAAYNISAALTYTTQLINVLAFYLDVRLPSKLCYSEFCGPEVSEQKFARRVARLNWNVLHLCFSQSVDPNLLKPFHTLHNILHLLDTQVSDLGRVGPVEVDPVMAHSLEDQLRKQIEDNSDDSSSEEDSDHLPCEWEAVPHVSCPEVGSGQIFQQYTASTSQTTSVATGIVNSAAASIASIWKGWTGHR